MILILLASIIGCTVSDYNQNSNYIIKNNLEKFKKVIKHYNNPSDSLKLQAAKFLIENMHDHYSASSTFINNFYKQIITDYPNQPFWIQKTILNTALNVDDEYAEIVFNKKYDTEIFDSDSLIQYIDNIFNKHDSCFWYKLYPFHDFCEYILPYRLWNEPIISNNDSLVQIIHNEALIRTSPHLPYYQYDLPDITSCVRDIIHDLNIIPTISINIPEFGIKQGFECKEIASANCYLYNSIGIPRVYDFVPHWGNKNGRHAWATSPYKLTTPFSTYAKIYRRTYSHNPIPSTNYKNECIPSFFKDPFNKDVTKQYGNTINLTVNTFPSRQKFANIYLFIFNEGEWRPIAWKKLNNRKTVFEDLGKNVLYLPGYYSNNGLIVAGYPIIIKSDGTHHLLSPDKKHKQSMRLYRKYPMNLDKIAKIQDLSDAIILGYDTHLQHVDTLATIPSNYMTQENIPIHPKRKLSYIKIMAKHTMRIAEISLFDNKKDLISFSPALNNHNEIAVCDNNNLTSTLTLNEITLKVDMTTEISELNILPANDDNWIAIGEHYELMYLDKGGWISCGRKIATNKYIEYDNVPANAVYILRNLSKGIEERPFTYKDGIATFSAAWR